MAPTGQEIAQTESRGNAVIKIATGGVRTLELYLFVGPARNLGRARRVYDACNHPVRTQTQNRLRSRAASSVSLFHSGLRRMGIGLLAQTRRRKKAMRNLRQGVGC